MDPLPLSRSWVDRRRDQIVDEIQRSRRGDYRVPTWLLVAAVLAAVAGWILLIVRT